MHQATVLLRAKGIMGDSTLRRTKLVLLPVTLLEIRDSGRGEVAIGTPTHLAPVSNL
jgi:hypothetical protein